jgi:hypothetical protein
MCLNRCYLATAITVLPSFQSLPHLSLMLRLKDALKLMDRLDHRGKPIPFALQFITADRKRDSGGELMDIQGGILSKHNKLLPLHMRRVDGFGGSKKPASYENQTRNVQSPDGSIMTVHIRLIKKFNDQIIIW